MQFASSTPLVWNVKSRWTVAAAFSDRIAKNKRDICSEFKLRLTNLSWCSKHMRSMGILTLVATKCFSPSMVVVLDTLTTRWPPVVGVITSVVIVVGDWGSGIIINWTTFDWSLSKHEYLATNRIWRSQQPTHNESQPCYECLLLISHVLFSWR